MEAPFDAAKDAANVQKHGISLSRAFISIGPIDASLYVLAHTYRNDEIRPISLRLAERPEKKFYRESW